MESPINREGVDPDVASVLHKSGQERLRLAYEAWELARRQLVAFLPCREPKWTGAQVAQ